MRHLLIDTDTASDDAMAILMALREPAVHVEAITVVAGNLPLSLCVRNALISIEQAQTYEPPVYAGLALPMLRQQVTAEETHGDDGMGNMGLADPVLQLQPEHAVDQIIATAHRFPGELEIVALGPLTNLAVALLREPRLPELVKHLYIMGGAGLGPGNATPVAEFNIYADAEAAQIVIGSPMAKTLVGWDICMGSAYLNWDDVEKLRSVGRLGEFSVRCNATLIEGNKLWGREGFDPADPTAMAAALYPDMISQQFSAYCYVEYKSEACYGQLVIDQLHVTNKPHNANIVVELAPQQFKQCLFDLMAD